MKIIVPPWLRYLIQGKRLFATVITLVAFYALVNLGLWQLSRADEKRDILQRVETQTKSTAVALGDLTKQKLEQPTGVQVSFIAAPLDNHYLLLDNQNYQGSVGYLALQLVRDTEGRFVLVERGFISAPSDRRVLPEVEWLTKEQEVFGRLYRKSTNPLSEDLHFEQGVPARIQNLNIGQLEEEWQSILQGNRIENYVIQPLQESWPYPQPWQPVSMSPAKHTGYAVQWFAMATALLILTSLLWRKGYKNWSKE